MLFNHLVLAPGYNKPLTDQISKYQIEEMNHTKTHRLETPLFIPLSWSNEGLPEVLVDVVLPSLHLIRPLLHLPLHYLDNRKCIDHGTTKIRGIKPHDRKCWALYLIRFFYILKGVFAKNERGYRLNAIKKSF